MSEDDAETAKQVGAIVGANLPALSDEEIGAVLDRVRAEQLKYVFLALVQRMRGLEKPLRLEAERDGWKHIATRLLKAAFGDDIADNPIPPIELADSVRRRADGEIEPGGPVALIAQWWANLTFQNSERRAKREHWQLKSAIVGASQLLRAAERRNDQGGTDRHRSSRIESEYRERWRQAVDELDHAVGGDRDDEGDATPPVEGPRTIPGSPNLCVGSQRPAIRTVGQRNARCVACGFECDADELANGSPRSHEPRPPVRRLSGFW